MLSLITSSSSLPSYYLSSTPAVMDKLAHRWRDKKNRTCTHSCCFDSKSRCFNPGASLQGTVLEVQLMLNRAPDFPYIWMACFPRHDVLCLLYKLCLNVFCRNLVPDRVRHHC